MVGYFQLQHFTPLAFAHLVSPEILTLRPSTMNFRKFKKFKKKTTSSESQMTQHCCHFARMAACLSGPILPYGIVQPFAEQEDTTVCMVNHTWRDPGKADPQFIDAVFHLEKWTKGGKMILRENLGGPRDCVWQCTL